MATAVRWAASTHILGSFHTHLLTSASSRRSRFIPELQTFLSLYRRGQAVLRLVHATVESYTKEWREIKEASHAWLIDAEMAVHELDGGNAQGGGCHTYLALLE